MDLSQIYLYHFTNINNLQSIIAHGLICDSSLSSFSYTNSGDSTIKERRLTQPVPFGGCVGDYVPFYFAPRSPMLYRQFKQGNIVQENIIYLVTNSELLISRGYTWCFSDRNAAKNAASFYNTTGELQECIDWDLMGATYWNNTDEFPDRQDRRMAEFLVRGGVNSLDLLGVAAYDDSMAKQVRASLPQGCQWVVHSKTAWYF